MRLQSVSPGFHRPNQFDLVVQMFANRKSPLFKEFVEVKTTKNYTVKAATEGGFEAPGIVAEGEPHEIQDFSTPYYKEVTPAKRGFAFSVSSEASESDHQGIIASRAPKMVDAIRRAEEIDMANLALNLATSALNTTPDGLSLANAAHLREGDTFTNIITGSPVLSYASLVETRKLMMEMPWHTGDPSMIDGPFALLVPPALEDMARRLTGSNNLPTTADNDINWAGKGIKVISNPYFGAGQGGSDVAFAMVCTDSLYNPLLQYVRRPLKGLKDESAIRDATTYVLNKIWIRLAKDPRGYVYSAGA